MEMVYNVKLKILNFFVNLINAELRKVSAKSEIRNPKSCVICVAKMSKIAQKFSKILEIMGFSGSILVVIVYFILNIIYMGIIYNIHKNCLH